MRARMDAARLASLGRRARDLVCSAAVIAMVAHNYFNVRAARDMGADDEAWYVAGGVLFGKPGFPNGPNGLPIAELGPLHCLSYFPLSRIYHSPVDLYFAAWQLRTTLIALAIYAVVRRARASWWQALLASYVFVNCEVADLWPFPVHTAVLVVLLGVLAASFTRSKTAMFGTVTIAFAVAGFCRPELLYAYAISLIAFAVHLVRLKERKNWPWLVAALAPGVLLFWIFGNPLGGTRSYYAFGQHYTLALFRAKGITEDPWANWMPTVERDFPGATTVGQAIRANPGAFIHHIGRNFEMLPWAFFHVTRLRLPTSPMVEYVVWAVMLGVIGYQLRRVKRDHNPVQTTIAFAIGCALIPFVLSIFIVHPRDHYFVGVVVLTITLAATAPVTTRRLRLEHHAVLVGAACIASVVFTDTKSGAGKFSEWVSGHPAHAEPFGKRQRGVARLRELHLHGKVVSLEYAWGTCMYAGYDCVPYLRWDKWMPFDQFVTERNLDVIVFDDEMARDNRYIVDDSFKDFLVHPADHGFDLEQVPGVDLRIGVRRR